MHLIDVLISLSDSHLSVLSLDTSVVHAELTYEQYASVYNVLSFVIASMGACTIFFFARLSSFHGEIPFPRGPTQKMATNDCIQSAASTHSAEEYKPSSAEECGCVREIQDRSLLYGTRDAHRMLSLLPHLQLGTNQTLRLLAYV